jgi:hypothetical protein
MVRGEAYLMLRDGEAAAAEFQKFIDQRGVVTNFPWGALARLGLPAPTPCKATPPKPRRPIRISSLFGKAADPDIPILIAAKAEYATLQ